MSKLDLTRIAFDGGGLGKAMAFAVLLCCTSCFQSSSGDAAQSGNSLSKIGERHLKNIKQLTFGGDNAEAYFSFDGTRLVFQATNEKWGATCDQIYVMPITGYQDRPVIVSTGKGRTTCSYFMPGDSSVIYASTHNGDAGCPHVMRSVDGKYVWPILETFDLYVSNLKGEITKQFTNQPGYDAEATVSPDGKKIVFTSTRSGDLELWVMNVDGTDLKQVTNGLGYDGGAFFSPDSKQLVFRASRPKSSEEVATYKALLAKGYVQPTALEIFTSNIDGSNLKQITNCGGANWAPFFHPSGKSILFCSNHHSPTKRQFNIFKIDVDGKNLEQVTFDEGFDSFPMFSPDGKYLVFSSNRNNGGTRDTNIFLAEWVD